MRRSFIPLILALVTLAAACADDPDVIVAAGAETPTDDTVVTSPGGPGDGEERPDDPALADEDVVPGDISDDPGPGDPVHDETEIPNTAEPVSAVLTNPTEVVVSPDDDSVLWVRFIGGDPNCTAARVDLITETPETVFVELYVGITDDALVKSCLAGEFPLRVAVPLNEPATGKVIDWAGPAAAEGEPIQITPDLTTDDFVGLTEAEAGQLADEQLAPWRVTRVDDEWFAVTADYNPGRLNFEIENGVVAVVTLG